MLRIALRKKSMHEKARLKKKLENMQIQIEKLIEASKAEGENVVIKSIEESRRKALAEADSIIKEAQIRSKNISAQVNNQTIQRIIDILTQGS